MAMTDTAAQSNDSIAKPAFWARVGTFALHTTLVVTATTHCLFIALVLFMCFALDLELGSQGAWIVIIQSSVFLIIIVLISDKLEIIHKGNKPLGTYGAFFFGVPVLVGWHAIVTCIVILVRG